MLWWRRRDRVPEAPRRWRPSGRALLLIALVVLLVAFTAALRYLAPAKPGPELSLDELAGLITAGRVAEATFLDEDARIVGTFVAVAPESSGQAAGPLPGDPAAAPAGSGTFVVAYPKSDSVTGLLLQALTTAGAQVAVDSQPVKAGVRITATVLLPLMILATLFALLFTGGRGGGLSDIRSFGTLGRRGGGRAAAPDARFDDVAGAEEATAELAEVVAYLSDPQRYAAVGASAPKGVLLFGPPGCGKTLLARATAGEAGVPFFSVAGAEFVESLVGVGAARIRDLFAGVRAVAPAILFIDELDAAGRRRGSSDGGGSDEREQTLNQLLVEMDGFDAAAGVVVMAATNRPDILDPALLRPGRFDRHVIIDQPDIAGRERILGIHARDKPLAPDVDLREVARQTPGFTGADLANVMNEAGLLSIRAGHQSIGAVAMNEAIQRVVSGPQRRGRMLTDAERTRIAVHEAGHAIVAAGVGRLGTLHRVSIVARGRGLGAASLAADRDAVLHTCADLRAQLTAAMSGPAAEELVLGTISTASEADLERATELARDIAARYGMSERIGRVRLMSRDTDLYLGGGTGVEALSAEVHSELDREVRRLLNEAFAAAIDLLEQQRPLLDELVARLLAVETVDGPELEQLLAPVGADADEAGAP
jgi:cell division protease FtsH